MAVRTTFPLSLVVKLSSVSFPIDIDIFRFFPNYSYTVFVLPSRGTPDMLRTESSSAVSQDYFVLVSPILGYNLPRLGPWAPMNKWDRATNYWAPYLIFYLSLSFLIHNNFKYPTLIKFSHRQTL